MKDLAKIRLSVLTEDDLTPKKLFYPQAKRKEKAIMRESKVNDRTSFADEVCGILNPIVYALNKGKDIKANSHEHKTLLELLRKADIS